LFALNEVIEGRGEKLRKESEDYLSRYKNEHTKEEAANLLDKVNRVNWKSLSPIKLKGEAKKGEAVFNQIAQNLDHAKFHFYEPLTEEGRKKQEQESPEQKQFDPIVEGVKISAQREVNQLLQVKGIRETDLTEETKNKIDQIKNSKKITGINDLKSQILVEIKKRGSNSNSPSSS
jgi:hypothetical protein